MSTIQNVGGWLQIWDGGKDQGSLQLWDRGILMVFNYRMDGCGLHSWDGESIQFLKKNRHL